MASDAQVYTPPRWRLTRWLVEPGAHVSEEIRVALVGSLYGTLPIFAGGVVNTISVSLLCALRLGTAPFALWLALECAICLARLVVLVIARRRAAAGRSTPTDLHVALAPLWAASVGYGTFISLVSGDWVVAALSCLSAAAMVGGTCFRNFGAPRMAAVMIALSLGPTCPGAALSGQPFLYVVLLQIPFYLVSMTIASYRLNAILVSTMQAERDNERRAQQDALTGLSNRTGLSCAIARRGAAGLPSGAGKMALLYLDLDGFKLVNDTHGHFAGDQLLGMVADRLRRATPGDDCVARIGGDEFVLVCDQVDAAAAQAFGERLIDEIAGTPYPLAHGASIQIGVSIGIALGPDHGADLTTLLTAADRALYAAKALGRGHCAIASAPGADPVEQLRDLLPAHMAALPRPGIAAARTPPVAA